MLRGPRSQWDPAGRAARPLPEPLSLASRGCALGSSIAGPNLSLAPPAPLRPGSHQEKGCQRHHPSLSRGLAQSAPGDTRGQVRGLCPGPVRPVSVAALLVAPLASLSHAFCSLCRSPVTRPAEGSTRCKRRGTRAPRPQPGQSAPAAGQGQQRQNTVPLQAPRPDPGMSAP